MGKLLWCFLLAAVVAAWAPQLACATSRKMITRSAASTTGTCSKEFQGATYSFASCADLDSAGSFKLAWTYDSASQNLTTWFEGVPQAAYGWASWGFSSTGQMNGGDVLVGYVNPSDTTQAKAAPYRMDGYKTSNVYESNALNVDTSSLAVEVTNSGNTIRIMSTLLSFSRASDKVIFIGGFGAQDFSTGVLLGHKDSAQTDATLDLTSFSSSSSSSSSGTGSVSTTGTPSPSSGSTSPSPPSSSSSRSGSGSSSGSGNTNGTPSGSGENGRGDGDHDRGQNGSSNGSTSGSGSTSGTPSPDSSNSSSSSSSSTSTSTSGSSSSSTSTSSGSCERTFQGTTYSFENCASLDTAGSFQLSWTYDSSSGSLSTWFEGVPQKAYGWVSWGFSATGRMAPADVLIAYVDSGDTTQSKAAAYHMSGYDASTVVQSNALNVDTSSLAVEVLNSGQTMRIKCTILQFADNNDQVIWMGGYGASDYSSGSLLGHADVDGTQKAINFVQGTVSASSSTPSTYNAKIVHAWLSAIGFGVLMPLGIIVARHFKLWADPAWYYTHIAVQVAGCVLGIVGWAYGIWLKAQIGDISAMPAPQQTHYALGIAIFCTSALQVVTPVVKPLKSNPARLYWNLGHWTLGYSTVIMSIINIYFGFFVMSNESLSYGPWKVLYTVVLAVMLGVLVLLEPFSWRRYLAEKREKEAKVNIEEEPKATTRPWQQHRTNKPAPRADAAEVATEEQAQV